MSHSTLNGLPILSGTITLPRQGLWQADLVLEAEQVPTGRAVLAVGPALQLSGVVLPARVFAGEVRVRVIGGAGCLRNELGPRWYVGAPRRLPLVDLCEEAGERLSSTSDEALLDEVLSPGWARLAGTAAEALGRLLEGTGASWRILPDGTLWVGPETWRAAQGMADLVVLDDGQSSGHMLLATEAPQLLPGQTIQGNRVSDVVITIEPEALRLEALLERGVPGVMSRLGGALWAMIETLIRRRTDYLAWYDGTVVQTDGAGRLEVKVDDPKIGVLTSVQLRQGIPGCELKLKDGARVQVSWESGNPRRPIARPFDEAGLDELRVVARTKVTLHAPQVVLDEDTGRMLARIGDLVAVGGVTTLLTLGPPGASGPAMMGAPLPVTWLTIDPKNPGIPPVPLPQLYGAIVSAGKVKG